MARVTLISPYPNPTNFGLRTISAHLKAHGHAVDLVFLPDSLRKEKRRPPPARYGDRVHEDLAELCAESDLVGVSVMTNYFDSAVEITERLRQNVDPTIIWGGIHPTVRPEECLNHADLVCVGEGEDTALQLANRIDDGDGLSAVPNLVIPSGSSAAGPMSLAATEDLDSLPPPDLGLAGHFLLHEGRIHPLTPILFEEALLPFLPLGVPGYQTMTGRGCPHGCTYCANRTLKELFCGRRYLRWRSTDHVMAEFRRVREVAPSVGFVWLADDAFFARPTKAIREFCDAYKRTVGLPFSCLASPPTVTEEKLEILVDAGMVLVQMGIESGSPRTQSLYDRRGMSNQMVLRAVESINRLAPRMYPPHYDFIIDNPYEDPGDKALTLELISRFPKPYHLNLFSLVFYPGTDLHRAASRDGLITDEVNEIYRRRSWATPKRNFFNLVMLLASEGRLPRPALRLLALPWVGRLLGGQLLSPVFWGLHFGVEMLRKVAGRIRKRARRKNEAPGDMSDKPRAL